MGLWVKGYKCLCFHRYQRQDLNPNVSDSKAQERPRIKDGVSLDTALASEPPAPAGLQRPALGIDMLASQPG